MHKLSGYILTKNSEKYLDAILGKIAGTVDEIKIIDSGSTDATREISEKYPNVEFIFHRFDNFRDQRDFALSTCTHDYVFFLDSDEIPNEDVVRHLQSLKESGFSDDVYTIRREWFVLGKRVHSMYPVVSPDYPVRLMNRRRVNFSKSSLVHEGPEDFQTKSNLDGCIFHYTFHDKNEMKQKLESYTDLAAIDLINKGKTVNLFKIAFNPLASFFKWYLYKNAYKDGLVGLTAGDFAYKYTLKKYLKARRIMN